MYPLLLAEVAKWLLAHLKSNSLCLSQHTVESKGTQVTPFTENQLQAGVTKVILSSKDASVL